jgi:hypothetical protein
LHPQASSEILTHFWFLRGHAPPHIFRGLSNPHFEGADADIASTLVTFSDPRASTALATVADIKNRPQHNADNMDRGLIA